MSGTLLQPLNNRTYHDIYGGPTGQFPNWWETAGGRLVPLESGIGTRVWLKDFSHLTRDALEPCRFWKIDPPLASFDVTALSWRFWIYGPFSEVVSIPCGDMDISEWLFYSVAPGVQPQPFIRDIEIISSEPVTEFKDNKVCAYYTREITQRMCIGMFYLGVVVVEGTGNAGEALGMTPAERAAAILKLPPMWAFVQDSQRNFHGRFEDIPLKRRTLCP